MWLCYGLLVLTRAQFSKLLVRWTMDVEAFCVLNNVVNVVFVFVRVLFCKILNEEIIRTKVFLVLARPGSLDTFLSRVCRRSRFYPSPPHLLFSFRYIMFFLQSKIRDKQVRTDCRYGRWFNFRIQKFFHLILDFVWFDCDSRHLDMHQYFFYTHNI